ncbi:MAG: hypothetical protein GF416_03835 [Candidatus Altiarchaeales archaeon]|nr:hypothetical protein [Candidatus Altiarchaeales archaeon]MBD3416250.1 hypothetical protein [Candidatus Altiarchaeales archaeon]
MRIFLSAFVIYLFFIHWTGWNENSRLDLSRSIVEEGRLHIDTYASNTGDRAYYNGHYYSDKPPGLSIVSTPAYLILDSIPRPKNYEDEGNSGEIILLKDETGSPTVTSDIEPGKKTRLSTIILTILASSLPAASNVILLFRILGKFVQNERIRSLVVLTYGLGTLAFPYALMFLPYSIGIFITLLAFSMGWKGDVSPVKGCIIGLLLSVTLSFDYIFFPIIIPSTIYLFSRMGKAKKCYILGLITGLLPIIAYNYLIFGQLTFFYKHMDSDVWVWDNPALEEGALPVTNLWIPIQVLFYPYRGLFFYYPVLLFSVVGLARMRKRFRGEFHMITSMFLLILGVYSTMLYTWHGHMFGPRYFTPLMPFLMIPTAYALSEKNKRIFLLLMFTSISVNILGLQNFENIITDDFRQVSAEHVYSLKGFTYNPLFDHYLPLTADNGPRSRLFENIIEYGGQFDIRDIPYSKGVLSSPYLRREYIPVATIPGMGFFVLRVEFLCLIPLTVILALIWRKELSRHLTRDKSLIVLAVVTLVFLLAFVRVKDSLFTNGWYPKEGGENGFFRFTGEEAEVLVYNTGGMNRINIMLQAWSPQKGRDLEILLNNELLGTYNILPQGSTVGTTLIKLKPGTNKFTLRSTSGCDNPPEVMANGKTMICYSFGFSNISFKRQDNPLFRENWYMEEEDEHGTFKFMSQNATLNMRSTAGEAVELAFTSFSFHKKRELHVYVNGEDIGTIENDGGGYSMNRFKAHLTEGDNEILFHSVPGCDIPSEVGEWDDTRCLSFGFRDIKIE